MVRSYLSLLGDDRKAPEKGQHQVPGHVPQLRRSAAQAERFFSLLGHIQTDDRFNMSDSVLQALSFVYTNKDLYN